LQKALGCTVTNPPFVNSTNITTYVEQFVSTPPIEAGNIQKCN
jgi:hypothetical protein